MTMIDTFEQKTERLLEKFHGGRQDFISQISEWRNEYRKAIIVANLQDHAVIKSFASKLFDEIEGMNYRLQNEKSDKLPQEERDRLLDKRSLYEEFVYLFVDAKKKVASIENAINENLK